MELKERLRAGQAARVEDMLASYPDLADDEDAVLELILAEMSARNELGEKPPLAEWEARIVLLIPNADQRNAIQRILSTEMVTLSDSMVAPAADESISRTLMTRIGKYQVLEEIGRGGMGVVYKARQMNPNRIVALKMILAGEHAGLRERTRLRNEAEAAAKITHPNIVQIIEADEHEGLPFLAMEYVDGGNLSRMLRAMPQPIRWAARLIETLARAIHVAHQAGIVHRDLNPTNILMTQDGVPKIGDFGLAKFLLADAGISQNGVLLGTPSYMAPEQVSNGGKDVGPKTDVYALGAALYEMLTGSPPFRGLTPMETLCQVAEGEIVAPSKLRHGLPPDLETICLKCLERNPSLRYADAQELADDLRRFQAREPIRARRTSRSRRSLQWARREPLAAGLLGLSVLLLLLLLIVVGGYSYYLHDFNLQLEKQSKSLSSSEYMRSISKHTMALGELAAYRRWYDLELSRIYDHAQSNEPEVAIELFDLLSQNPPKDVGFEWRYVDRMIHRSQWVLGGDPSRTAPVEQMAVSRDGRSLVSGDADGKVVRWDVDAKKPFVFPVETAGVNPIRGVALHCDAAGAVATIAAVSVDDEDSAVLNIWDAQGRHAPWVFRHTFTELADLAFSREGALLAFRCRSDDKSEWWTRFYEFEAGEWTEAEDLATKGATCLLFSTKTDLLVVGGRNGTIVIRDLVSKVERLLPIPKGARPVALAFSSDDARLAVGCEDGSLVIWELSSGTIVATLAGLDGPPRFLTFCLNDEQIVACEGATTVALHGLQTPSIRRVLPTGDNLVTHATVSADGRRLALGFETQRSSLWNLADLSEGSQPLGQLVGATKLLFSPDGRSIFMNFHDALIFVWRTTKTPPPLRKLAGHAKEAWAVAFSRDGETLASGADDHQIKLWDVATGDELAAIQAHDQTVSGLAFSPKTGELASVSLDGSLKIWEFTRDRSRPGTASLKLLRTLRQANQSQLRCVGYSVDGDLLAASGLVPEVLIFDPTNPDPLVTIPEAHSSMITALAFTPSPPSLLSTASCDSTLKVWDPLAGYCVDTKRTNGALMALAYSPELTSTPKLLATSGDRRIVSVWNTRNRDGTAPVQGHPHAIRSLAFSSDALTLATGCDDGKVRLCDALTSQIIIALEGHLSRVNSVAFSPDDSVLASCSHSGEVFLWRAEPESPPTSRPGLGRETEALLPLKEAAPLSLR